MRVQVDATGISKNRDRAQAGNTPIHAQAKAGQKCASAQISAPSTQARVGRLARPGSLQARLLPPQKTRVSPPRVPCLGQTRFDWKRHAEGNAGRHPGLTELTYNRRGGPHAQGSWRPRQGEQVTPSGRVGVQGRSDTRVQAPKYAQPRELEPVGRTQGSSSFGAHAPVTQRVGSMGHRSPLDTRARGADAPDVPTPGHRKAGRFGARVKRFRETTAQVLTS